MRWSVHGSVLFIVALSVVLWAALWTLAAALIAAPWFTFGSLACVGVAVWLEIRRVQRDG